jgi:hypothetical protein
MVYGPNLDFMYWVMDRTKTDTGRLIPMSEYAWAGFELINLVVICTDCTGSCLQLPYDHEQDGPLPLDVIYLFVWF